MVDVQMITVEEEKMRMENVLAGINDSLSITRAQKAREQQHIPKKEERSKNEWWEQRHVRKQAQEKTRAENKGSHK